MTVESRLRADQRERRRATKAQIVTVAKALLAERPWVEVSVDDLMSAAGSSRTAFYRHFDDRQQLLLALLGDLRDEMGALGRAWAADEGEPVASTRYHLGRLTDVYAAHGPVLRALSEASSSDAEVHDAYQQMADGFIESTAARIARDVGSGASPVADPTEAARALVWLCERYLTQTLGRGDPPAPVATIKVTLGDIWVRSIYSPLPSPIPHLAVDRQNGDGR